MTRKLDLTKAATRGARIARADAERAALVLPLLPASTCEIAAAIGWNKHTAYGYLCGLHDAGYICREDSHVSWRYLRWKTGPWARRMGA